MKPLIIHHNDWDGWVAAWIAKKSLGDCETIATNYGEDHPDVKDREVYILDFSYPRKILESMNKDAKSLLVLDHHKSAERELKGLDFCKFDMSKSGARMAWDHFMRGDPPKLVLYVEDRDLWQFKLPESESISALIMSYPFTFGSYDELDAMLIDDLSEPVKLGRAILNAQERHIESAIKRAEPITLAGQKGLSVNMAVLFSDVAGKLAEDAPFGVCWYQTPKGISFSLRSRGKDGVDVSEIAEQFGGGGHANAAGFMIERASMDLESIAKSDKELIEKAAHSHEYLSALLKQARDHLPTWLWKQLHEAALPAAGGAARWRQPSPLTPLEKVALADMKPDTLAELPEDEVRLAWLRLNQWYGSAKKRGESVDKFVRAASFVRDELKRRGVEIDDDSELSRAAAARGTIGARLADLPAETMIVPSFISLVGSTARGDKSKTTDVDVLFRADRDAGYYKIQADNVWLPLRNAIEKAGLSEKATGDGLGLHYIDNPQGAHGDHVPLYDLVLRRCNPLERRKVSKSAPIMLDLGCGSSKADGYVGIDKSNGDCVDLVYNLELGIPYPDNSVKRVRAYHVLEHVAATDRLMREIWRAMEPGGELELEVPSTRGEGAFAHPDHKSFWNKTSLVFWTSPLYCEDRPQFELVDLEEIEESQEAIYVRATLRKPGGSDNVTKAIEPFRPFIPPKPQLAGFTELFTTDEVWIWAKDRLPVAVEPKFNGFRAIAERKGDKLRLWSEGKPKDDLLPRLPGIAESLEKIHGNWTLDLDLAIERGGRRLPRPELMRLNADKPEIADNEQVVLTVFDLPYLDGDLSGLSFKERRSKLEKLSSKFTDQIRLSPIRLANNRSEIDRFTRWAFNQDRSEGAMYKDLQSKYTERSVSGWAKLKRVVELKVKVLDVKSVNGGGYNYRGGLTLSEGDNWKNVADGLVDLGWTFNTEIEADKDDVITVQVLELIPMDDPPRLVWLGARVIDVDETRKNPFNSGQAVNLAQRGGVLQKSEVIKQNDEEGETRGERSEKFWEQNWQEMYPKSGEGKFVYHHHWRGLSEDQSKLTEKELFSTDHSVHGDLRFTVGDKEDGLWGFSIFLGKTEENTPDDKLVSIKPDDKLRVAPKLRQPYPWVEIGIEKPHVAAPGEAGSTLQSWSKFFAEDHGKYKIGVWHRHLVEVFPEGNQLNGRLLFQSVPIEGGQRAWMVSRPENQKPMAESEELDDVLARLKARGHKWLVWAKPGEKPKLYDVKAGRVAKSFTVPILCSDDEKQVLYCVVAEPGTLDAHGHRLTAEEIEHAAHEALPKIKIGLEHKKKTDAFMCESIIIPPDVKTFYGEPVIPGSWIGGFKINNKEVWNACKSGEYTGVSFGGYARKVPASV